MAHLPPPFAPREPSVYVLVLRPWHVIFSRVTRKETIFKGVQDRYSAKLCLTISIVLIVNEHTTYIVYLRGAIHLTDLLSPPSALRTLRKIAVNIFHFRCRILTRSPPCVPESNRETACMYTTSSTELGDSEGKLFGPFDS